MAVAAVTAEAVAIEVLLHARARLTYVHHVHHADRANRADHIHRRQGKTEAWLEGKGLWLTSQTVVFPWGCVAHNIRACQICRRRRRRRRRL